jgi:hypothetical protein
MHTDQNTTFTVVVTNQFGTPVLAGLGVLVRAGAGSEIRSRNAGFYLSQKRALDLRNYQYI